MALFVCFSIPTLIGECLTYCRFNDCTAVVKRTNTPFGYDLVVSRADTEEVPDNEDEDEEGIPAHIITLL